MRDDLKVCNCATCGQLLVASAEWSKLPNYDRAALSWVAGRILGRPYCPSCLRVKRPTVRPASQDDGPGPWGENAVRAMEGE